MRILFINKYLYPKGGAETYFLELGQYLADQGHQVEYFGMDSEKRTVGNRVNAYTKELDFHEGSFLSKWTYPFRIIYSDEARRKIRAVLDDFQPDVCHLNNFNFQLTPSILLEIKKWKRESGHHCKVIYTAHDPQLVCPSHLCRNGAGSVCERCLGGNYFNCIKGKCIHNSLIKSVMGTMEAEVWNHTDVYNSIDTVICCSAFIKVKIDTNSRLAGKTVVLRNFVKLAEKKEKEKGDYVLYFGRFSEEKGINTLLNVCKELPEIQFFFAGKGPLEPLLEGIPNVKNCGFHTGEELEKLIREARFSVCPSEWYENCPFSVIESQMYGTPILGADIGGVPELIQVGKTGELFESGNEVDLKKHICDMWQDEDRIRRYSENCLNAEVMTIAEYTRQLMGYYQQK